MSLERRQLIREEVQDFLRIFRRYQRRHLQHFGRFAIITGTHTDIPTGPGDPPDLKDAEQPKGGLSLQALFDAYKDEFTPPQNEPFRSFLMRSKFAFECEVVNRHEGLAFTFTITDDRSIWDLPLGLGRVRQKADPDLDLLEDWVEREEGKGAYKPDYDARSGEFIKGLPEPGSPDDPIPDVGDRDEEMDRVNEESDRRRKQLSGQDRPEDPS